MITKRIKISPFYILLWYCIWCPYYICQSKDIKENVEVNFINDRSIHTDSLQEDLSHIESYQYSKFGISLKGGIKCPIETGSPSFDAANYYGFGIKLNLGKYISVQPEITYWKSVENFTRKRDGKANERAVMICLQNVTAPFDIKFYLGTGGIRFKYSEDGNELKEDLNSINLGAGYGFNVFKKVELVLVFRYQRAGWFGPAGGPFHESFSLGISPELNF